MPYSDQELAALLREVKTIAVVGAKDSPSQPVNMVGRYLIDAGFRVIPVHPKRSGVWGLKTYPSLEAIPEPVDLVDLFRAPEACPAHAEEVLRMTRSPLCFWMQSGIDSATARGLLFGSDIAVVANRCLMVDHQRLVDEGLLHG